LGLGRPDRISLIFARSIYRGRKNHTPGTFATRVVTDGVTPSLHVHYKHTQIKQYVRHEAHRCIPGTVGRNLEDYSWVADLPESERRTGKQHVPKAVAA